MPLIDKNNRYKLYNIQDEDWGSLERQYGSMYRGRRVFLNICKLLKLLGCKTILIEKDYVDYDYRNEFSHFYSTVFSPHSNLCTRLHFFKNQINSISQLRDLQEDKKHKYLGYVIIRPLNVGKIGRTVLQPYVCNPDKYYLLCAASYKSHIFGKEFSVIGTPFIRQDTMVMRCAQASIWMATRFLSQKHNSLKRCLPYDITASATQYPSWVGRPIPSSGLTLELMVNSLSQLGYPPLVYSKKHFLSNRWDPVSLIYKYVESQIPVIVIVPNHAITIIGHTFNPNPCFSSSPKQQIISSEKWIDSFIIHDDALGPYRLLPVSKKDKENFTTTPLKYLLPPKDWLYHTIEDIRDIIIPLPFKVYLPGISIDSHVKWAIRNKKFLAYVLHSAKKGNSISKEFLSSFLNPDQLPLVFRSYFVSSQKYKAALRTEPLIKEMVPQVRIEYENMKMPHFIWITEITNVNRLSHERERERTIFGEIVIDSTANRYGLAFLAIHLPGVLILRNTDTGNWRSISLPKDKEYHHPTRQLGV